MDHIKIENITAKLYPVYRLSSYFFCTRLIIFAEVVIYGSCPSLWFSLNWEILVNFNQLIGIGAAAYNMEWMIIWPLMFAAVKPLRRRPCNWMVT